MIFTLALLFVLLSVSLHELGHAFAMRECKVHVKEICLLGFPVGAGKITLPNLMPTLFPNTKWVLHPLILGAYVEPEEEDVEKLSYVDKTYVFGNGIIVNFLYTLILFAIIVIALGGITERTLMLVSGLAIAIFCTYRYRKLLCAYLFPLLSLCILGIITHGIVTQGVRTEVGGIQASVEIIDSLTYESDPDMPFVAKILLPGCVISFILGAVNLMAMPPLDGGHIAYECLKKIIPKGIWGGYQAVGILLLAGFTVYVLFYDLVWIYQSIFG